VKRTKIILRIAYLLLRGHSDVS